MGLDCHLAIRRNGVVTTISLDRFYVFADAKLDDWTSRAQAREQVSSLLQWNNPLLTQYAAHWVGFLNAILWLLDETDEVAIWHENRDEVDELMAAKDRKRSIDVMGAAIALTPRASTRD